MEYGACHSDTARNAHCGPRALSAVVSKNRLLASTTEYRGFLKFCEDSSGGVSYLPPRSAQLAGAGGAGGGGAAVGGTPTRAWGDLRTFAREYSLAGDRGVDPGKEKEHWIPSDAVRLSIHFKQQHLPVEILQSIFTLECGHRPSQTLNSSDQVSAPLY